MTVTFVIQIGLIAFLAWGGVLSLLCLLRDRTWTTRVGA